MKNIIVFSFLLSMIACDSNVYYSQSFEFEKNNWHYHEQADFEFEINDTVGYYDLVLDVTHDVDYSFENIYVKIHTMFPSGEKVTDQVSLQLADELDQWEGKCSGSKCKVSILLQSHIFFKEAGKHEIKIEQFNRLDPLMGISKLQLRILNAE